MIRALEPVAGRALMRERRGREELTNGPARLTQALGVGPELQRHRLDGPPLWIEAGAVVADSDVVATPRIGISKAKDWELRFCVAGNEWLSRR